MSRGFNNRKMQALQMKQLIQETGAELFAEHGFVNVSMVDIAERIGCSTGNIYYHFKSREALAASLAEFEFEKYHEITDRYRADNDTPAMQRILNFVEEALALLYNEPYLYHGLSYSLTAAPESYGRDNSMRSFAELFQELLPICREEGSLHCDNPDDEIIDGITLIMYGCILQHYYLSRDFSVSAFGRQTVETYLAGLNASAR